MNIWSGVALNTAPDSQNQIHSDELAKEYGFEGGLVPGVTISAYLVHPMIDKWGFGLVRERLFKLSNHITAL